MTRWAELVLEPRIRCRSVAKKYSALRRGMLRIFIFAHAIDMRFVCGYYDLYAYHCQWFKATEVLLLSNEPVDEWF